jgi:hypothetical protein
MALAMDQIPLPELVTAIETRAFPSLARRYPRDFTFYVTDPTAPFAFTIWLATSLNTRARWPQIVNASPRVYLSKWA